MAREDIRQKRRQKAGGRGQKRGRRHQNRSISESGFGFRRIARGQIAGVGLVFGLALGILARPVRSQVIPDNTLGTERSIVTPNAMINGLPADRIDGGATRGANLFHSFQEFNVNPGQRLYFANPSGITNSGITNIFSRVTGSNRSDILGTLGVAGSANLFLLNPNGILFGPNAQLDIRGSFLASTADRFDFGNGLGFSATDPQAPPLLTLKVPIGLQYGADRTGTIASSGNLAVGQDLTLEAGNLDLAGQLQAGGDLTLRALDRLRIRDSGNAPFIAAAGDRLLVQGNQSVDIFALNHPNSGLFAGSDLVLRSANAVGGDAHYWSGGDFRIEQLDGNPGNLFSPHDPIIRASGDVTFTHYVGPSLHILAGGGVTVLGDITITDPDTVGNSLKETVTLSDGTSLAIDGEKHPTLDIRAGTTAFGSPGIVGDPLPTALVLPSGNPTRADIRIDGAVLTPATPLNQNLVFLTNQYKPNSSLSGDISVGHIRTASFTTEGGTIVIDSKGTIATHDLVLPGFSTAMHKGGDVILLALEDINLNPGSQILSFGKAGGRISLSSGKTIRGGNTAIRSGTFGAGVGEDVTLTAQSIVLTDNAELSTAIASPFGGQGGRVIIDAEDEVFMTRGGSIVSIVEGGTGNGGDFILTTRRLIVQDDEPRFGIRTTGVGSTMTSDSRGRGGNVIINASESIELIGNRTGLFAPPDPGRPETLTAIFNPQTGLSAIARGSGDAGNLTITTPTLIVRDGAEITTSSLEQGNGGTLRVNASHTLDLRGAAGLITATQGRGNAGQLIVEAGKIRVRDGAFIAADTIGSGNAGQVEITTKSLLLEDGGSVSASTSSRGRAGTLSVTASELMQVRGVSAEGSVPSRLFFDSFNAGDAGELVITTPRLIVEDGGQVSAATVGSGQGGIIAVEVADSVEVSGTSADGHFASGLFFDSRSSGDARGIRINAGGNITVQNGGQVTVSSSGTGRAGDVEIVARSIQINDRSKIAAETRDGPGGSIRLQSQGDLPLQDGGEVTVSSQGRGRAGDIEIEARSLLLTNQGKITAGTLSGEGGNINIRVDESIVLRHNSEISTEARGTGNGGNIRLEAGDFIWAVLSENSDIVANAFQGRGGNIFARAQGIFGFRQFRQRRSAESDFIASSEFGIDGMVALDVRDFQPDVSLPEQFTEAEIGQGCSPNRSAGNGHLSGSRFVHTGRGGVPTNPAQALAGSSVRVPWVEGGGGRRQRAEGRRGKIGQRSVTPGQIVEARGWVRLANGDVLLTARPDAIATQGTRIERAMLALPCQTSSFERQ